MCQLCCQIFKRRDFLVDHIRGKHNIGKPFKCECGAAFKSRTSCFLHRRECLKALDQKTGVKYS